MLVAIPEAPETSTSTAVVTTTSAGSVSSSSTRISIPPGHPAANAKSPIGPPPPGGHIQTAVPSRIIPSNASLHSKFQEIRGDPESGSGGNAVLLRRVVAVNETNGSPSANGVIPCNSDFPMMDPLLQDHAFQQQLLQLKQEQELQHQLLLQRYQAQRQQLAQAHEKQLQQRLKEFWENKRRQDEERERLEALKSKDSHEQSAVASTEVKQKLQGFLLKKQREAAMAGGNCNSNSNSNSGMPMSPSVATNAPGSTIPSNASPPFRTWSVVHASRAAAASAAAGGNPADLDPSSGGVGPFQSHPYRRPLLIAKYEEDFPLRKTASEPNLLKMRLKQRVLERRSSPLVRRKERSSYVKRRSYLATMDGSGSAGSTPDSGPNSPPISCVVGGTPQSGSGGGTPHEDGGGGGGSPYGHSAYGPTNSASVSDLTLYSSPSLPNISLGRPIPPNSESKLAAVSETEVRCPVNHQSIVSSGGMPVLPLFYPPPPHAPLEAAEMEALYQSGGMMALYQAQATQAVHAAHAQQAQEMAAAAGVATGGGPPDSTRVGPRSIHRPLGRTQSAPLPLGHPMLHMNSAAAAAVVNASSNNGGGGGGAGGGAGINNGNGGNPVLSSARSVLDQQQQQQVTAHQLLRQHIRQTVLTRVGSRGQVMGSSMNRAVSVEEDSGEGEEELDEQTQQQQHLQQQQQRSAYVNKIMHQHLHQQMQQQQMAEGSVSLGHNGNIPSSMLSAVSAIPQRLHHHHSARPLSRALSSPLVALGPSSPQEAMQTGQTKPGGTGLAFDGLMLKHQCLCGDNSQHPEHPGRLQSIWARLQETGLIGMCERIRTRKATLEEIQSCHSEAHTLLFGTNPLSRQRLELSRFPESSLPIKSLVRLPCNGIGVDSDTAWNELHTPSAARMAVGCVLELAFRVATNGLRNGFAIVRPPGHHAEPVQAMGFCFFNSVAIAARQLRARLQLEKIMLVDWDVHHGNGTQQIFYDDPHVLYLSIHRHDEGNFFPGTGGPTECGIDDGMGFNVNIPWSGGLNPPMGDAEYLAAFRSVVMPIAQDFQPDIILVSCGFDAAAGHPPPLGGYRVSPACFGWMTKQLMTLAGGKVVLALEGGYDLPAICDSAQEVVKALLGETVTQISDEELVRPPCAPAIDTLLRTIAIQTPHWPCIKRYVSLAACSALEAASSTTSSADGNILLRERVDSETVSAMASLSMHQAAAAGGNGGSAAVVGNSAGSGNRNPTSSSVNSPSSSVTSRRRSSDMNVNDENSVDAMRGTSEEPMDQDEPTK